jgi:TonB family protein
LTGITISCISTNQTRSREFDLSTNSQDSVVFAFPITWKALSTPLTADENSQDKPLALAAAVGSTMPGGIVETSHGRETEIVPPAARGNGGNRWEMVIPRMSRPAIAKSAEIDDPQSPWQHGTSEPRGREDVIRASENGVLGGSTPERAFTASKPEVVLPPKAASAAPSGRLTWTMLAAVLIVLAALGAVFAYKMRTKSAITRPSQSAAAPSATQVVFAVAPLQLQVERQGDGLNVRWHPESSTIAKAREGRLTIVENGNTRVIALNAQQLTRGHVYYQPSADQVEFTLEVVDGSGATTEEFVLALSSKTNRSVQSIPLVRPAADLAANKKEPRGNGVKRSNPRTFELPSKQDMAPAAPTVIRDAPPVVTLDSMSPLNNLPVDRNPAAQLTAVAPVSVQSLRDPAPSPPPAPEIKPAVRVAQPYEPPVPKKKTSPILPASIAARFPPDGRVEVTLRVHVDETGRVTRAEAEPKAQKTAVDHELERMAIDAALQWRFEPAHSGDRSVQSDQGITFVFQRGRGQ